MRPRLSGLEKGSNVTMCTLEIINLSGNIPVVVSSQEQREEFLNKLIALSIILCWQ